MADQYQALVSETTLPVATDPLIAGSSIGRVEQAITIVTGEAALPRGTVMGKVTASGKYRALAANADGSEVPAGILAETTLAATADVTSYMYRTGEFNEALVLGAAGAAVSAADKAILETLNIYLRKVY